MSRLTPKEKWENLKREFLIKIQEIDNETPWENPEPDWWLEMSKFETQVI